MSIFHYIFNDPMIFILNKSLKMNMYCFLVCVLCCIDEKNIWSLQTNCNCFVGFQKKEGFIYIEEFVHTVKVSIWSSLEFISVLLVFLSIVAGQYICFKALCGRQFINSVKEATHPTGRMVNIQILLYIADFCTDINWGLLFK